MLGALEVSENCDIANWIIPGKMMKGMGGAMDLVACGSKVIVLMEHAATGKDGKISMKLLSSCKLPLTAKGVVSMVITEMAVFENRGGKLVLTEIAKGVTLE
jgi:3-oxoacid CoA-transferase B subunit